MVESINQEEKVIEISACQKMAAFNKRPSILDSDCLIPLPEFIACFFKGGCAQSPDRKRPGFHREVFSGLASVLFTYVHDLQYSRFQKKKTYTTSPVF